MTYCLINELTGKNEHWTINATDVMSFARQVALAMVRERLAGTCHPYERIVLRFPIYCVHILLSLVSITFFEDIIHMRSTRLVFTSVSLFSGLINKPSSRLNINWLLMYCTRIMVLGISVRTERCASRSSSSQRSVGLQQGGESVRLWASSSRLHWRPVLQVDERSSTTQVDGNWINSWPRLHDTQRCLVIWHPTLGNRHHGYDYY